MRYEVHFYVPRICIIPNSFQLTRATDSRSDLTLVHVLETQKARHVQKETIVYSYQVPVYHRRRRNSHLTSYYRRGLKYTPSIFTPLLWLLFFLLQVDYYYCQYEQQGGAFSSQPRHLDS